MGEAFRYSRWEQSTLPNLKCPALRLANPYNPPQENDASEYARGFEAGWKIGDEMVRKQSNLCKVIPKIFDIKISGVDYPFVRPQNKNRKPR